MSLAAVVLLGLGAVSYHLRPASRRLAASVPAGAVA